MSEKEYIFVGNAQLKTRDYIKQLEKDNIEKDNEIERLNKEIKEYQEELEKADSITQSCIFEGKEEATKSYRECLNLLERLHSIIKEVRKHIENNKYWNGNNWNCLHCEKLLEILDKEGSSNE